MSIEETRQKLQTLNAQATKINALRNQNIGTRKALEEQCTQLFNQYRDKYNISLTAETLQQEIDRVVIEKEKESELISSILTAINEKDYNKANQLAGIEVPTESVGVSNDSQQSQLNESKLDTPDVSDSVSAPNSSEVSGNPSTSVTVEPPSNTVQAQRVAQSSSAQEESEEVVAPPVSNVAMPNIEVPNLGFDNVVAPPKVAEDNVVPPSPSGSGLTGVDSLESPASNFSALDGFEPPKQTPPVNMNQGLTGLDDVVAPPSSSSGGQSQALDFASIIGGSVFNN